MKSCNTQSFKFRGDHTGTASRCRAGANLFNKVNNTRNNSKQRRDSEQVIYVCDVASANDAASHYNCHNNSFKS